MSSMASSRPRTTGSRTHRMRPDAKKCTLVPLSVRAQNGRSQPAVPENDAALDVMHWTGHTGCVILAPHLVSLKKKDLGLPHYAEATERQRVERRITRPVGRYLSLFGFTAWLNSCPENALALSSPPLTSNS